MKNASTRIVCIAVSLATAAAFARPSSGKISATLFDGQGNKEVLAEATRVQREVSPAPQPVQPPQVTTTTITDGKGGAVFTREQKGGTTTVRDGKGSVVSSTTQNADGSTTTRDGTGRVRATTGTQAGK